MKLWCKVRLKSGGPEMTTTSFITEPSGEELVICKWNDEEGHFNMTTFPLICLDLILPD